MTPRRVPSGLRSRPGRTSLTDPAGRPGAHPHPLRVAGARCSTPRPPRPLLGARWSGWKFRSRRGARAEERREADETRRSVCEADHPYGGTTGSWLALVHLATTRRVNRSPSAFRLWRWAALQVSSVRIDDPVAYFHYLSSMPGSELAMNLSAVLSRGAVVFALLGVVVPFGGPAAAARRSSTWSRSCSPRRSTRRRRRRETPGAAASVLEVERALSAKGFLASSSVDGHYGTRPSRRMRPGSAHSDFRAGAHGCPGRRR